MELFVFGLYILSFLVFLIIIRKSVFNVIEYFLTKIIPLVIPVRRIVRLINLRNSIRSREGIKLLFFMFRDKIFELCGGHITRLYTLRTKKYRFYYLDYYHNRTRYRVIWPTAIIPSSPILSAVNKEGFDILEVIKPCMGPDGMFHGSLLTPEILGFEQITFTNSNMKQKKFKGCQTIILE